MAKIKIDPEWDNLAKEAAQARNAGVTYGVFEGRRYAKEQERILERERRYAEYKARKERERRARRAAKKAQAEREAREKAGTVCLAGAEERAGTADSKEEPAERKTPKGEPGENPRKCLGCGKVLTGNQRKYCSVRCEYLVHQEERKMARKKNTGRTTRGQGGNARYAGRCWRPGRSFTVRRAAPGRRGTGGGGKRKAERKEMRGWRKHGESGWWRMKT